MPLTMLQIQRMLRYLTLSMGLPKYTFFKGKRREHPGNGRTLCLDYSTRISYLHQKSVLSKHWWPLLGAIATYMQESVHVHP